MYNNDHPEWNQELRLGLRVSDVYRLHGRVVKRVAHPGHDEAMEAGGREFDPRPGHYSRMSFSCNQATGTVFSSECAFLSKF